MPQSAPYRISNELLLFALFEIFGTSLRYVLPTYCVKITYDQSSIKPICIVALKLFIRCTRCTLNKKEKKYCNCSYFRLLSLI